MRYSEELMKELLALDEVRNKMLYYLQFHIFCSHLLFDRLLSRKRIARAVKPK